MRPARLAQPFAQRGLPGFDSPLLIFAQAALNSGVYFFLRS